MRLRRILKIIEDHILDFYKNLYAESISSVLDTDNMEDFIGTYIPAWFPLRRI